METKTFRPLNRIRDSQLVFTASQRRRIIIISNSTEEIMMAQETLDGPKANINKYINASPNPVFTEFTKVSSAYYRWVYILCRLVRPLGPRAIVDRCLRWHWRSAATFYFFFFFLFFSCALRVRCRIAHHTMERWKKNTFCKLHFLKRFYVLSFFRFPFLFNKIPIYPLSLNDVY